MSIESDAVPLAPVPETAGLQQDGTVAIKDTFACIKSSNRVSAKSRVIKLDPLEAVWFGATFAVPLSVRLPVNVPPVFPT
jgi:hypothetical protein